MNDLFSDDSASREPLAARMRPRNLDEYIGQNHIVGKGRLLRRAIAADQLTSVIFYGPPGCGKTTLARVIANHTKSNFITLNAVLSGVAEIRTSIKQAEEFFNLYDKKTILFVDEVHRWNKSQQDALLPWVENGTIILIGATTENPFFEVNKALVSRSRVFQLKPLTEEDMKNAAIQALNDKERGYGKWKVVFEKGALEHLIETANGDARSLLNALELAVETTPEKWSPKENLPPVNSEIYISFETAEESIQKKVVLYDRDGDYHYDIISAFIKSLRGRDPDAAMYWLARMVKAGEDPHFIFRRMLISACEDTGLADPYAINVVNSCAQAFDRVGMPEGRYFLAHAALYLSTAKKSNSSMAFFDALSSVEKEDAEVPNHLKDANRDSQGFGHGEGYMYPHAYKDHWVAQQYLPDSLLGRVFYTPTTQGYEGKIREEVLSRREIQIATILENSENESFEKSTEKITFTPKNNKNEKTFENAEKFWRQRLDSNKAEILLEIRNKMIQKSGILRHQRNLIWNADNGLLLWEISRKTPEGFTCGVCKTKKGIEFLNQYSKTLEEIDRPHLILCEKENLEIFENQNEFKNLLNSFDCEFDRFYLTNPFFQKKSAEVFFQNIKSIQKSKENPFSKDSKIIISQRIFSKGQRISNLIYEQLPNVEENQQIKNILKKMSEAENEFFEDSENSLFNWNENTIEEILVKNDFLVKTETKVEKEKRKLSETEIQRWFDKNSIYGKKMHDSLSEENIDKIIETLIFASKKMLFNWKNTISYFVIN